jgi:heme-degrading monooxygenase HmoA
VIVEVGLFRIDPVQLAEFAPVADDIRRAFAAGDIVGMRSFHMAPAIEDPGRWAVVVAWDSTESHEKFVASAEGMRQRLLLERFMTEAPEVLHYAFDGATEGLR